MDFTFNLDQTLSSPLTTNANQIIVNVKPLAFLAIGIVIYFIFIFKFYKYLAQRDILMANWNHKYSWDEGHTKRFFKTLFYLLEYVVIVPIIIFLCFLVMATILLFVSNNSAEHIMLISMAIIAAGRLLAYYNEELAREVGKLMPLTLMAIFVSDMSSFSLETTLTNAKIMFSMYDKLLFYLMFAVVVEFIMRIFQLLRNHVRKKYGINKSNEKKAKKLVKNVEKQPIKINENKIEEKKKENKIDLT